MKKLIIGFLVFCALILSANAVIPKITAHVTDRAGILSPSARTQMEEQLKSLEKLTNGVQFVVYIEKEYPKEYSLEEYTLKMAEDNKIGKKGNDNGILLYVAVDDKQFRWEVGYGIEGTLNAALLGRISREYMIPNFKEGNYEKGIMEAVDITSRILLGSNDPDIIKIVNERGFNPSTLAKVILVIILVILAVSILIYISKQSQKSAISKPNNQYYNSAASGIFMGGFGRGGFSGGTGGFGGFSGGGGTFGGGGFSSRW